MGNQSGPLIAVIIVFIIIASLIAAFSIIFSFRNKKYKDFVFKHSVALSELVKINEEYEFIDIKNFNMVNDYDNEHFYYDIEPVDYLTYRLVNNQKEVLKAMRDTEKNKERFDQYIFVVKKRCIRNIYDIEVPFKNRKALSKIEERLLLKFIQRPITEFTIRVTLELRRINGELRRKKYQIFYPGDIRLLITRINRKNGTYYLDHDIWDSLCKVERGKVSNKMRFAIYQRDGYRCKRCGSTRNLEVDHIIPISKGGKSTFDNLQTLCHRCNINKGANIEYE